MEGNADEKDPSHRGVADDMPIAQAIDDDPDLRLRLGRYLGGIRKLQKKSQDEVAKAIGVSRPHLSNVEQGRSRSGWKGLRGMASYYSLGIEELIKEVGQRVPAMPAPGRPRLLTVDVIAANAAQMLSDDERFVIGLYRVLDAVDQRSIAKQIVQLAQQRSDKVGKL